MSVREKKTGRNLKQTAQRDGKRKRERTEREREGKRKRERGREREKPEARSQTAQTGIS